MSMIKYEIKRVRRELGVVTMEYEYKTVNKKELKAHYKEMWSLHRKKYFGITYFLDWWRTLDVTNKVNITIFTIGSIITIIIAAIGWVYFID